MYTTHTTLLHVSMETSGRVSRKFWVINTLEAFLAIENSFETSLLATEKSEIFQVKLEFFLFAKPRLCLHGSMWIREHLYQGRSP